MRSTRSILVLTTLFALIIFILNALPSTVILDDDSKIVSSAPAHRTMGIAPDLVLTALLALVWGVGFVSLLGLIVPRQSFALTTSSIARAPPWVPSLINL